MRHFLLLLACLIAAFFSFAQRVSGNITGPDGKSIEYVNIGIPGTTTGMISDGEGYFTLYIPEALSGRELVFSHVSYEPVTVPITDLLRQEVKGEGTSIRLSRRSVALQEVIVLSGKGRYKRIGAGHLSALNRVTAVARPRIHAIDPGEMPGEFTDSLNDIQYNGEIISPLRVHQRILLREISFPVISTPHDSVLLRLNLYEREGDDFRPVHSRGIYTVIPATRGKRYYHVDVSDQEIVLASGKYYAGVEVVHYYGFKTSGGFVLPAHPGAGYMRTGIDLHKKIPIHPGIQIYGRLLND